MPPCRLGPSAILRRVLAQYHRGQVTVPRLVAQLRDVGVDISKRQVIRLFGSCAGRGVLRRGLEGITVDDTGARHRGRNGVCTQSATMIFPGSPPPPPRAG